MTSGYFEHPQLGRVEVKVNARARQFTFRINEDGMVVATVPTFATRQQLDDALLSLLPRLQAKMQSVSSKRIDANFRIDQPDFKMALREGTVPHVQARMSNGTLDIVYPPGTPFDNPEFQKWLIHVAEEALRYQAKLILPKRLLAFANQHGLKVNNVSIHKTQSRWGSRSSRGNINLSLYLVLLPRHLQDYVMLHELTHILHMDHSPRFWAQLDQFCGGNSLALRKEMEAYNTSIFFRR